MVKSLLIVIVLFFASLSIGFAQEPAQPVQADKPAKKSSCGCRFQSVNQVGLVDGGMDTDFHLQTINGLRFGNWFTGIGVGIDYYYVRSVPLFLDVRNYWFKKRNSPFAYADIGINFPWAKDNGNDFVAQDINYNQGLYYDIGLGYKLGLGNNHALLLSTGFTFKRLSGKRKYFYCPFLPPCAESFEEFDYKMNRISMKFGWEF